MQSRILGGTVLATILVASQASALVYSDGSQINLAQIRGVTATASSNVGGSYTLKEPLHPAYGTEIRWSNGPDGSGWYMLDLGDTYQLSSYTLYTHTVIGSLSNLTIKASTTALTDPQWAVQPGLHTFNGVPAALPSNGQSNEGATGSFAATPARYVRLEFEGQTGWNEMIFQHLRLFGPNSGVEVNNRISLAQSTWAGATAQWSDPWFTLSGAHGAHFTTIQPAPNVNDDFQLLQQYFTNADGTGQDANPPNDALPVEPTRFYINLNQEYKVEAVGWATIGDIRAVRNMDIYTSPDPSGSNWVLAGSLTDLPYGAAFGYQEFSLGSPTVAQRVRFDVNQVWNLSQHSTLLMEDAYFAEFYVYGVENIPEPSVALLLALGGLVLLGRRRGSRSLLGTI